MTLNIKHVQKDKEYKLIPEGTHVARLVSIVDFGTQPHVYMGENKTRSRIYFTFELPNETSVFEGVTKPLVIGSEFTASLSDKAILKPIIEGVLGKKLTDAERTNFGREEISKLVGTPVMLSVLHNESNGKTYANIATVSPLPKGMAAPEQYNPSVVYDVLDGQNEAFKALPEFMRNKILASLEMRPLSRESSDKIAVARNSDAQEEYNSYPENEFETNPPF